MGTYDVSATFVPFSEQTVAVSFSFHGSASLASSFR